MRTGFFAWVSVISLSGCATRPGSDAQPKASSKVARPDAGSPIGSTASESADAGVVAQRGLPLGNLDSLVAEDVFAGRFSGVILVSQNGQPAMQHAYGLADEEKKIQVTLDTRFDIASTTKCFTAVAVAQLVERGKLSFDATLGTYWPDYPNKTVRTVTIHQLLTHTAGLGDVARSDVFRRAPWKFKSLKDYVWLVQSQPLVSQPGTGFHYSDAGFVLLGALVERVSHQSYYDYVQEHIFVPAGMKDSGFKLRPRPSSWAVGYRRAKATQPAHRNDSIFPTLASPAAAAYSTAEDLLRFGTALLKHQLLSQRSVETLFAGKVDTQRPPPNQRYAYGFFSGGIGALRIVNHGGTGPGIDVGFDLYPDVGYVAVILANRDPPAAQMVRDQIRKLLAQ